MGLLSKIKKGLKKLGSAVTKVFKAVTKPIKKALSNKWVRRALMAVTFFTGAGAVLAAFQAGGLTAGMGALGQHLVNVGVKIVRTPFDIVAGGLKAAGGLMTGVGANSLGTFATNLGQGLSTRVDSIAGAATNIFAKTPTTPGATPPTSSPVESVSAPGLETAGDLPVSQGSSAVAANPTPTLATNAAPVADKPGLLTKAVDWAEKNPELTKIGVDAVAAMTAPDEYTRGDEITDQRNAWRGAGNGQSADPFGGGGLLSSLRRRNEELYAQGQTRAATLTGTGG